MTAAETLTAVNDVRTPLVAFLAAAGAAGTLWFTGHNYRLNRVESTASTCPGRRCGPAVVLAAAEAVAKRPTPALARRGLGPRFLHHIVSPADGWPTTKLPVPGRSEWR